jgi:hypothetical protein
MLFRTILSLAVLSLFCFATPNRSAPLPVEQATILFLPATDNPSVSGQIASVGDASFTVEVKKSKDSQTVEFAVDDNTKVEGKLAIGAQAVVEYRSEGGKNIATHVIVHAPAGP